MQVFLHLAWREFHELKWAVVAALVIATLAPLLSALQISEMAWFWVQFNLVFYPFAAGFLFGMHLAAGERGGRTAALLAATPVSPRLLGTSKLFCTAVAALLPIVQLGILGGLVHSLAGPQAAGQSIWPYCGSSAICTLQVLLVVGVFGLGQKTELLAAGRGLIAMAAWAIVALGVSHYPQWRLLQLLRYLGPPIDWFDPKELSSIPEVWLRVAGFIVVEATLLTLAIAFVARYRRAIEPLAESPAWRWPLPGWLPDRLSSPLAALWWKQLRETVPFGLLVLVASLLLSMVWSLAAVVDQHAAEPFVRHRALTVLSIFAIAAAAGGFALALLLGVGLFAADLEPRINTFWRSRPISAEQWFWTKFAMGFVALVITVGLPALAAVAILSRFDGQTWQVAGSLYVLLYWFCMYSAAVLATCLVRQILYAAVLAVVLLMTMICALPYSGYMLSQNGWHPTDLQQVAFCLTAAVTAIVLAWQAATHDFAFRTS